MAARLSIDNNYTTNPKPPTATKTPSLIRKFNATKAAQLSTLPFVLPRSREGSTKDSEHTYCNSPSPLVSGDGSRRARPPSPPLRTPSARGSPATQTSSNEAISNSRLHTVIFNRAYNDESSAPSVYYSPLNSLPVALPSADTATPPPARDYDAEATHYEDPGFEPSSVAAAIDRMDEELRKTKGMFIGKKLGFSLFALLFLVNICLAVLGAGLLANAAARDHDLRESNTKLKIELEILRGEVQQQLKVFDKHQSDVFRNLIHFKNEIRNLVLRRHP